MRSLELGKAYTLMEPSPVILVSTHDGCDDNVMTVSWSMVLSFSAEFAIMSGPWNHSFEALEDQKECVLSIPTIDLLDEVIGVGTCSGRDTDKFEKVRLSRAKARHVRPPLILDCIANIECRVVEILHGRNLVVLEGLEAYLDTERKEKRMIHAVGDGTFIADGRKFDRKAMMQCKLPPGF